MFLLIECFTRAIGHPAGPAKPEACWSYRNYVRSSFSQSVPGMTKIWTQHRLIAIVWDMIKSMGRNRAIHMGLQIGSESIGSAKYQMPKTYFYNLAGIK